MTLARGLTRLVFSISGFTAVRVAGQLASVCPDIGSAGTSQHATEPYPLLHLHAFLFPLTATSACSSQFTMSEPPSTSISTPSSNFQFESIFNAALKAYEKKTRKDLLAHPLAAQLQACKSPDDILAVLQDKVNELDQSMSADERLSQWLKPTINVLYSFSATIGAGVGIVSAVKSTCFFSHSSPISQVFSPASVIFSGIGVLLSVSIVFDLCVEVILTMKSIRRPKMLNPARMRSSISSSVSKTSSNVLRLIYPCRRQTR